MKQIILVLAAILTLTVSASAEGTRLELRAPQGPVSAGETYQVAAVLTGNPGFHSIQFALTFDVDTAACSRIQAGPLIQNALWAGNRNTTMGAAFAAAASEIIEGDGTLAVFHFRAKDDMPLVSVGAAELLLYDRYGEDYYCESAVIRVQKEEASGGAEGLGERALPDEPPPRRSPEELASSAIVLDREQEEFHSGGSTANSGGTAQSGSSETARPGSSETARPGSSGTVTPGSSETARPGSSAGPGGAADKADTPEKASDSADALPAFTDTAGHWAAREIGEAVRRDLFHGYADGSFRPNQPVTRGQYVLVLWNLAGRPAPSKTPPFRDTDNLKEEFQDAIAWAWEKEYVQGTAADRFSPGDRLTRQAAMKILFGYNGGISGTELLLGGAYDSVFTDSASLSGWAREGVYWAVYHSILKGTSPTTLNPRGGLTRAQLAAIMVRYTDSFPAEGSPAA